MPISVNRWRGDAQGRAQVDHIVPALIEKGDTGIVTCNRKDVSFTVPQTATIDSVTGYVSAMAVGLYAALTAARSTIAEFADAVYSLGYDDADLTFQHPTHVICTGRADGTPFTFTASTSNTNSYTVQVVTNVQGQLGRNEKQRIQLPATTSGGTFTLTWNGQTTSATAYNATAATVQTNLEALSNIAPGDVVVTGGSGTYDVEFAATYAQTDVPLITGNGDALTGTGECTVVITVLNNGVPAVNEKQQISLPASTSGGTFTLTFDGQTTGNIAYDASAATVQAALEALSNLAANEPVTTKSGAIWTVEFKLSYSGVNVPLMTGSGALLTGACGVTVSTTTEGGPGTNEVGKLTFASHIASDRFRLRFTNPSGTIGTSAQQSATSYDGLSDQAANRAALKAALEAMSSIGAGNVTVTQGDTTDEYKITFVGSLGYQNVNAITVIIDQGTAPTYSVVTEGSATDINEVQLVTLTDSPSGGTFTLTYSGQTTAGIAYNAAAATVQTALEALSNLAPADVVVTGSAGGPYTLTFGGTLAGVDVAQLTGSGASLTGGAVYVATVQDAVTAINEKQRVQVATPPAAGGTFTLTFQGETTGTIAYNASTATMQAALEGLATPVPGDISVTGGPADWVVEFKGAYAGVDVLTMTGNGASLAGGTVATSTTQTAAVTVNEKQTVSIIGGATGGTFTLTLEGETTAAVAYNVSAANLQTALENLTTPVAGDVTVSGAAGGPWLCSFANNFGNRDVAEMTGDGGSLTGPGTQTLTLIARIVPTGPAWFNDAENWSLNAVPSSSHRLVFEDSDRPCLYGLSQAAITPDSLVIDSSYAGAIGLPDYNAAGYAEYRTKELTIGTNGAGILYIEMGWGEGSGPSLVRLNTGGKETVGYVWRTGRLAGDGSPAFRWKGTHASNTWYIYRGTVGIADQFGEAATLTLLDIGSIDNVDRDAAVYVGDGVTLATVKKTGGFLDLLSAVATAFTQLDGETIFGGAGAMAQLYVRGGDFYYSSSGTLGGATIVSGDGNLDFTRDLRAKTVTNPIDLHGTQSRINDHNAVVASLIVDLNESAKPEQVDGGPQRRITFGTVS